MPQLNDAIPKISVRLYKTIGRKTIDGIKAVSTRYKDKDNFIDLTPFMSDGSAVRTTKSVREPAGAFNITFADQAQKRLGSLETIYGLVEPMDVIEIRMWSGIGKCPDPLPIKMRGFVSVVARQQTMGDDGKPVRQVVISGQDYGKIWQTFQVVYLAAYAEGKALLTNFGLFELFGVSIVNAMPAGQFVKEMLDKVINPHIKRFLPANNDAIKTEIKTNESIYVKHGKVNQSFQQMQGSIYDILKFHGDVGAWNELYTEDRNDGVHVVYRPIPALLLGENKKIMDDAPDPVFVNIPDSDIVSISTSRTDASVGNFFWINNSRFDLIDDMQRRLATIPANDGRVSLAEYPNTAVKYYGVRKMEQDTQQGEDGIDYMGSGEKTVSQAKRGELQEAWLDRRRRQMMELNKENVVFESGSLRIKGGPMRKDGIESMKAGDYARIQMGQTISLAYIVQMDDEFIMYQGYTTTLTYERGTGFAARVDESASYSPWLAEQARRY